MTNVWKGLTWMLLKGIFGGLANVFFYALVMRPLSSSAKVDEVAINTYVLNFFVGWLFFSAFFLAKVDEEWKKVAEAVHKEDRATFFIEAPKRMALSIQVLYLLITLMVALSFHLFHIESGLAMTEIQFGVGFILMMTTQILWDLDDPVTGVINVPGIPKDWLSELRSRNQ